MIYEFKIPNNTKHTQKENLECEIIDFVAILEARIDDEISRLDKYISSVLEDLGPIEFVHYDTYSHFLKDCTMNKYGFYIPTENLDFTYTLEDL